MNLPWIIPNKCQSIKFLIPLCCEIFFGTSKVSSFFFSKIHSVSISLLFTLRKLLEKAKNKISVMKTLWLTCVMTAVQMIKTPKNWMYSAYRAFWEVGGVTPLYTSHVGMCRPKHPKGMVIAPFQSWNGCRLCLFLTGIGYGSVQGNYWRVWAYLSHEFKMDIRKLFVSVLIQVLMLTQFLIM